MRPKVYPFQPIADATVSLGATTSSSRVALAGAPRTGAFQVRVKNPAGGVEACIRFGDGTVVATTAHLAVPAGTVAVFTIPNPDHRPVTHVAAITASGTATLTFTTGRGL